MRGGRVRNPAARGAALCQWAVLGTLAPAILLALLPGYAMDLPFRLLCAGVETLLALCMGVCLAWGGSQLQKAEAIRRTARLLLAVYLVHLASLLFLDGSFGRQATFSWQAAAHRVNLRPFHTIISYWSALRHGRINASIAWINLAGNLLALAPLGLLLPFASRRWGRLGPSLWLGAALIAGVEVLQLATGTGSCDVDDFILNFAGFALARLGACWAAARFPLVRAAQQGRE